MWPRQLLYYTDGNHLVVKELEILSKPGVYVLYRNDTPFYVGQAQRLRKRLWSHAKQVVGRYYNFWNYFSVFAVEDASMRNQLESILIAAMPTANGATPRIKRAQLPLHIKKHLQEVIYPTLQLKAKAKAPQ